jgi:hypothetical protein
VLITQSYHNLSPLQEHLLTRASLTDLSFFLYIDKLQKKYQKVAVSRGLIAKKIGVCEKTVTRVGDKYHKGGLLLKSRPIGMPFSVCSFELPEVVRNNMQWIASLYRYAKYGLLAITLLVSAPPGVEEGTRGVPLYKLKGYIYIQEGRKEGVNTCAPARETGPVTERKDEEVRSNTSRKKESSMELPEIPEHIQSATQRLGLTTAGQLRLMSFTKEAVEHAMGQLKHMASSKDIFTSILDECKSFSQANGHRINWQQPYFAAVDAGLITKKDPATRVRLTAQHVTQSTGSKPALPPPSYSLDKVKEQIMAKQRAWEAQKSQQELQHSLQEGTEMVNAIRTNAGLTTQLATPKAQSSLHVAQPKSLTQKELDDIGIKRRTVEYLLSKGKLHPCEQVVLDNFQVQLKEFDGERSWTPEELKLIEFVHQYADAMNLTRHAYQPFLDEIALGPSSPRALNGELMEGFRLMRELAIQGGFRLDCAPKEESIAELMDDTPIIKAIENAEHLDEKAGWEEVEDINGVHVHTKG